MTLVMHSFFLIKAILWKEKSLKWDIDCARDTVAADKYGDRSVRRPNRAAAVKPVLNF